MGEAEGIGGRSKLPWIAALLAIAAAIGAGIFWLAGGSSELPPGIVSSNGRVEVERVDVSAKFGGRVSEIFVSEGDMVEAGMTVARMDTLQIEAQLREAEASLREAEQALFEARSILAQREAELVFAEKELRRARTLYERGFETGETVDLREASHATAEAAVGSAEAGVGRAEAAIEAAKATVERLRADLEDYILTAPRSGRVQYRLVEPGEVVPAGGRVVTLLDLSDVYMTVYLPTDAAGRLHYGAEARLVFDAAPEYVVPATVTFVATEAQFTPKFVETEAEREKLMFRVKVTIPPEILEQHRQIVKGGVPGVAHVRVDPAADWPDRLAVRLPDVR